MTSEVKNVPELRFPEFDGEWEELRIGQLAEIIRGSSPRPISDPKWFDNKSEIGWLRISDVTKQNGRITNLEQRISVDGQNKTRVLHNEHLLLSIAATVGKPVINYVKTGVHDGFLIFLNPLFDIEYMFQWLDAFRPKWKKYGQPGSQVNLNSELVRSQKIVIPDTVEQKRIAELFSKLDRQIELEEQKLEKLEEQKKGYMQKIFSQEVRFKDDHGNEYPNWETKKLDNILSERNYKQVPEKDVPLMAFTSTGGIEDKGERYNREFLVKNKNKKYKRTEFNDLIYSSNNLDVGAIGLNRYGTSVISDVYEIFVVKEKTSPQYIEMAITQPKFMYKILKYRQGALYGQFKIHPRDFLNIYIELPSTKEQNKIGDFLNELDELIEKQSHKIELLKERKKGFLQKMFV